MKFSENFRVALKNAGKTQSNAAEHFDVANNTISNWVLGKNYPNITVMQEIADWLNVSLKWLLFGKEGDPTFDMRFVESGFVVNAAGFEVSAVELEEYEEPEVRGYFQHWFENNGLKPNRCALIRVHGDAMQPLLWNDDLVLVNLDETKVLDGKVYAVRVGQEVYFRYLQSVPGGRLKLSSENPNYEDITLDIKNDSMRESEVQVLGRVRDKSGVGGL